MRVEKKTVELSQAGDGSRSAVKPVAGDWMANTRKMHADLMSAAGSDADFEKTEPVQFL